MASVFTESRSNHIDSGIKAAAAAASETVSHCATAQQCDTTLTITTELVSSSCQVFSASTAPVSAGVCFLTFSFLTIQTINICPLPLFCSFLLSFVQTELPVKQVTTSQTVKPDSKGVFVCTMTHAHTY